MMSVNSDLETLAHQLLCAVDEMQQHRRTLVARIERINVVAKSLKHTILPSTLAAIDRACRIQD